MSRQVVDTWLPYILVLTPPTAHDPFTVLVQTFRVCDGNTTVRNVLERHVYRCLDIFFSTSK